jgi:hypothetical protein
MAAFVASCGGIIVPALAAWGASQAAAAAPASSVVVRLNAYSKGHVAWDIGSAWAQGDAEQEQNWRGYAGNRYAGDEDPARDNELAAQTALLHDIFRAQPVIDPAWLRWRESTISRLSQAIYEERQLPSGNLDATRLAILGDALSEAGCSDEGIIEHLRKPGSHVRGCFAVDALLGRT